MKIVVQAEDPSEAVDAVVLAQALADSVEVRTHVALSGPVPIETAYPDAQYSHRMRKVVSWGGDLVRTIQE